MSIFAAVQANIGQVFGAVFLDAVLTRIENDPNSPKADPTKLPPVEYPCKAMVNNWSSRYLDNGLVGAKENKVIILQTSISTIPKMDDTITIRGETFKIVSDGGSMPAVTQDPAQGGWICRGRK